MVTVVPNYFGQFYVTHTHKYICVAVLCYPWRYSWNDRNVLGKGEVNTVSHNQIV